MKTFEIFTKILHEYTLYDDNLSYYDTYLQNIRNSKETLKNFNIEIEKLKTLLTNISLDDIDLDNRKYKDNENYVIYFGTNINILITSLRIFYNEIYKNNENLAEKINSIYFNGEELNLEFDIEIERNNFNKLHFPIDLPHFLKKIGLGKKILMKSINIFNYCLFNVEDSFELRMAVDSLTKMDNYYSFIKDETLIVFKDDFEIIKKTLKLWFNDNYEKYILDKDFHLKYIDKINNDKFLKKIYSKYS